VSISESKQGFFAEPGRDGKRPLLTISGLSAYYSELRALYDLEFQVMPGEVLAIIGANGAGKSTMLKSMVGMMNRGKTAHITGTIDMRGRRLERLTTEKIVDAGVTMVPEGRRLFPRLTVEENLLTGAYLARCREKMNDNLEGIYDMFPRLAERRKQVVNLMSGGEQQMVAIGRALMSEPKVVLFDELSLGLAPAVVDGIYEKVKQINAAGVTCIVIEQDMKRALRVSNHVLVLLEGAVVLEGNPNNLDQDQVTAAYFGSDNERTGI